MKKYIVILGFVSSFFIIFSLTSKDTRETILCLEIGNTRTKACLLPARDITLEDLQDAKTFAYSSKPWLNHNLDQLFKSSPESPLNELYAANPSKISLSIFGPVYQNNFHGCPKRNGGFKELKDILRKQAPCDVTIECDTGCWTVGALDYLRMKSKIPEFPCIAITLGTYVGVALVESPTSIKVLETWAMNIDFPHMKPFAAKYNRESAPIKLLYKKHIDLISGGEEGVEALMKTYLPDYNLHIEAFCCDMSDYFQKNFPDMPPVKSILIGGGFSRFIDLSKTGLSKESTFVLSPQSLTAEKIPSDIIQLLGCQKLCQEEIIKIQTYPSLLEVEQFNSQN